MNGSGSRRSKWDQRKIIEALRRRRTEGLPLHTTEIHRAAIPLAGAIKRYFGSHDEALLAAGIDPASVRRTMQWDRPKIIAALKDRAARGLSVRRYHIEKSDGPLSHAIRNYFDSYDQALRTAGIEADRRFRWTKDLIVEALRERRDRGLKMNSSAIKESHSGLLFAISRRFASHSAALRAAGIDADEHRAARFPTRAKIIAALRDLQAAGSAATSTSIYKHDRRLASAIEKQFGSYAKAFHAAGIVPAAEQAMAAWDRRKVIAALRDREKRGEGLQQGAIRRSNNPLSRAIARCFASHEAALSAAAIKLPGRQPSHWDRSSIIAKLKQRQDRGLELNHFGIRNSDPWLGRAMVRHFGSHDAALRAADIDPATARHARAWDKDKIVAAIKSRHRLKMPMNRAAFEKSDSPLAGAMLRYFDSHEAALVAAGIDPASVPRPTQWNKDKLIAALQDRHQKGLGLSKSDVRKSDDALRGAIRSHFGTHEAALIAAGFDPEIVSSKTAGHWTEQMVLQTLRDLHRDGHDLRYSAMKQRSQSLFFAAKKLFGSYVNAIREAGINYWDMSQGQLARERATARTLVAD
jgi:hypothetical protein